MANATAEKVASAIIARLEQGVIPWRRTWASMPAHNPITGTVYSGVNAWVLHGQGEMFATLHQLNAYGVRILKGSHGLPVAWCSKFNPVDKETGKPTMRKTGEGEDSKLWLFAWKYYTVFPRSCWDMTDASPEFHRLLELSAKANTNPRPALDLAEKVLAIPHNKADGKPSYSPSADAVRMPGRDRFEGLHEYYRVYFHELCHWTGAAHRLNRAKHKEWGDETYGREELVAELGAAVMSQWTGVDGDMPDENAAAYCKAWVEAIKADPQALLVASSAAGKAAEWLARMAAIPYPVRTPKDEAAAA